METPSNPHFMKPMLSGFETSIEIPLAFYGKHIHGKTNLTTAILRSDASDRTWEVKVHGRTMSRGWEDFAKGHDLRVGDVVFFRQDGEMEFHVSSFGPNCCEVQYTYPRMNEKAEMAFDFCFKAEVTASSLQQDRLSLPEAATTCKALSKQCLETILVNKDGVSWPAKLRYSKILGIYYIRKGWRHFCDQNGLAIGDVLVFNVVGDGLTSPLMCEVFSKTGECSGAGFRMSVRRISFDYCFVAEVTATNLSQDKMYLPREATRCNVLKKESGEAQLLNKDGDSWSVALRFDEACGQFYVRKGWRRFCCDNRGTVGDLFVFNVVGDGESTPKLCVCTEHCTELLTNYLRNKNAALDASQSASSSRPFTG